MQDKRQLRLQLPRADQVLELGRYDVIILNTSGGKDSQSMLGYVHGLAMAQGVEDRLVAVHADLGRVEWEGVPELAEAQAKHYGIRFIKIARPQGDLLDHVRQRGMWPAPATRYCTSDHKRGQIAKVITKLARETGKRHATVLNCLGFRAEESPARAKRLVFANDARMTNGRRTVDTWLPILQWTEGNVWDFIRQRGVAHHEAYDLGMPRLSCVLCIFAPRSALILAGRHNRKLLQEYIDVEREIGHRFRQDLTMEQVGEAVERGEQGLSEEDGPVCGAWNM